MAAEIKSDIKEDPIFSVKNFFKPTSKNVFIWCTAIKGGCITLITFATTLLMNNTSIAVAIILSAVVIGGVAESVIAFTREKPSETLVQAIVDVKDEKEEDHVD